MPLRRDYVTARFGQMHYRYAKPAVQTGKRPLLMFHMSPYSSFIYEIFAGEMGRDRLAIAIDTPGFGASDPMPKPPEIEDYASAMEDVMDALGLRDVDLMGYHTGCKIAMEVSLRRPTQVHRLINVSAAIYTEAELASQRKDYAAENFADDGSTYANWWKNRGRWHMKEVTKEMHADLFAVRVSNPSISWWGHRAAFNYQAAVALPKVKHPILILNPEADDLAPMTVRAKPLLQNPASRIHGLPGWAHGFLDVKTAEAAKLVRDFLDA